MTLPACSEPFGGQLPSADDRAIANQFRQILAAQKNGDAVLQIPDPQTHEKVEITLTPAMANLFMELFRHIGSGHAVTLVPIQEMLTTQQAADILNVSRPYLIKLLESEKMTFSLVGRHRRIKARDVFAYKARRDEKRSRAMEALLAGDADLL